ncbi:uncharacterized protein LOC129912290 [Episyrphus balteatus]|uniref:uncharacterized protein LOC129912290 n=1 Tax=Episyrphus balteatus TaxID=286459 RepID=UPI0024858008|nr:uncharacterized protein LOC129912290 [Episyrphus balteatus]XP_055846469.1 uncharacterized protein LOC129912290 [Episyrphus balteatus]
MPSKASSQCTTRRKHSLGKLRRAHPASGATWNVQVVRGKMSSKCLWHACRALILGMILMLLGAGMATVGYYADQLSVGSEIRGNATVRVKNETKGFHLNNLSYVGPIVMGFGGFIVVASCVMTFEARDSAAKVVPARFKAVTNSKTNIRSNSSSASSQRRANGVSYQNTRWDHHLGVFRSSPAEPPQPAQLDRQALTAALIHFSKTLGNTNQQPPKQEKLQRCGSVPNLSGNVANQTNPTSLANLLSPNRKQMYIIQNSHRRHRHHHHQSNGRHSRTRSPRLSGSLVQRTSRESACSLLQPMPYQKPYWNALSVDETGLSDSQSSRILDRTKRSDTAKRHLLLRQKPIENEDLQNDGSVPRRRSSTLSDLSYGGRWTNKCPSMSSRTPSVDSKKVQVDLHSPQSQRSCSKLTKRVNSGPSSTPSVEREFRSQLSICSEPITARQLSGQSSIEPCVLEESPESDEKPPIDKPPTIETKPGILKKTRPETLPIKNDMKTNLLKEKTCQSTKILYRSNSSNTFYRPKPRISNEYDTIFLKNMSGKNSNEVYDSLQVINERRKKILKAESDTTLLEKHIEQDYPTKPFEVVSQEPGVAVSDGGVLKGKEVINSDNISNSPPKTDDDVP